MSEEINMQIKMAVIETKLASIEKKLDDHFNDHKQILAMMNNFIEKADQRYASKLSERIIYGMVSFIVLAVLSSVIYLVIQ